MTITTECLLSINNFTGAHSKLEWFISYLFFRSLESLIMIGLYLLAISLAINLSKSKHYLVETEDGSVKLQSEGNFTFSLSKEKGAFRITLTWIQSWYLISENIEMDEIDAKNVSMWTLTNQKVFFLKKWITQHQLKIFIVSQNYYLLQSYMQFKYCVSFS